MNNTTHRSEIPKPDDLPFVVSLSLDLAEPATIDFMSGVMEANRKSRERGAFRCPNCHTDGMIWHYDTDPLTVDCENCPMRGAVVQILDTGTVAVAWTAGW